MAEENLSQEFRWKIINKSRNRFLAETKQGELMSKKHKKVPTALNYTDHFLILASIITGYISVSFFASFIEIPIKITIPAIELKISAITEAIKKYKSIIKEKKKKHDEVVLLEKPK